MFRYGGIEGVEGPQQVSVIHKTMKLGEWNEG